jgi:hypothetical protein
VQYAREYLKTVTERSATRPAVFTYRHVLYYDVAAGSDANSLSAGPEEPPSAPRLAPLHELVPRTASGVTIPATGAATQPATTLCNGDIESGLDSEGFDDVSVAPTVVGAYAYALPPVRIKLPALVPCAVLKVEPSAISSIAGAGPTNTRTGEARKEDDGP